MDPCLVWLFVLNVLLQGWGYLATPCVTLVRLVAFVHVHHDHQGKIAQVIVCLKGCDLRVYKIHDHFKVCLWIGDAEGSDACCYVVAWINFVHDSTIQSFECCAYFV